MAYDGEVRVSTALNNAGLEKGIKEAEKKVKLLENAFEKANDAAKTQEKIVENLSLQYEEAASKAKILRDIYKEKPSEALSDEIKEADKNAEFLFKSLEKNERELTEMRIRAESAADQIERAAQEYQKLSEKEPLDGISADNIQNIGQSAEQVAEKANRLKNILGGIATAAKTATSISISAFKKIGTVIGGIAVGTAKATAGIARITKNLLTLNRHSRTTASGVDKLWKRIINLASAAFVFNILRKGLRQLSDDMGRVLMANERFAASWNAIKVNLLTAFSPLWEIIEPAILSFMDLLARFTSVLAQFMATLFGKTYEQAKEAAKGIYDQAKAVDTLGKAAKKAVAPFDELIIMSSELGGTETDTGLDFSAVEPPDFSWIDTFAAKIKELTPDLEYFFNIGETLGKKITESLDKIPWDTIQAWANSTAQKIASLLNGAVAGTNPETIGKSIAGIVNTGISLAKGFLDVFDFGYLGAWVATALNKAISDIKWKDLGNVIGEYFAGVLNFLNEAAKKFNWSDLGSNLAKFLQGILDKIPKGLIGETLGNIFNGILNFLHTALNKFDFTDLGKRLGTELNALIKTVDWKLLGETLADIINKAFDFLRGFIDEFDWKNFGLSLATGLKSMTDKIKWEEIGTTLKNGAQGILTTLYTFFTTYDWGKFGKQVASLLNNAFVDKKLWTQAGATLASGINAAIDFLYDFVTTFEWKGFGESLGAGVNKFIEDVEWNKLGQTFSESFKGVLSFLITALGEFDWVNLGVKIREFLENIDWADISNKLGEVVGLAFKGIGELIFGLIAGDLEKSGENGAIAFFKGFLSFHKLLPNLAAEFITGIAKAFGADSETEKQFKEIGTLLIRGLFGAFNPILWIANVIDFGKQLIDKIKEVFKIHSPSKVMEEIGGFLLEGLLNGIKSIPEKVKEIFMNAWKNIKDIFSPQNIGTFFGSVVTGIKNAFSTISDWFKTTFTNAWQSVKNVFSAGGQIFIDIKDGVLSGLKAVINGLIDGINNVIKVPFDGINSALNAIRNITIPVINVQPFTKLPTINIPQIPRLARGGVVNSETIATIAERGREVVIPLDRDTRALDEIAERVAARIGGNDSEMVSVLQQILEATREKRDTYLNGRVVTEEVTRGQGNTSRRFGKTLLPT